MRKCGKFLCSLFSTSCTRHLSKSDVLNWTLSLSHRSVIDLPATDGSFVERELNPSHVPNGKLTYLGPLMPKSAIAGLTGDKAACFVVGCCTPPQYEKGFYHI